MFNHKSTKKESIGFPKGKKNNAQMNRNDRRATLPRHWVGFPVLLEAFMSQAALPTPIFHDAPWKHRHF